MANRCLGGIYQASFHIDRNCHFGFTSDYADQANKRFGRDDRHLEKWILPDEVCVRAIQILVPESELREPVRRERKTLTWLDTPPLNTIGTISLLITSLGIELDVPTNVPGASIVGKLVTDVRIAWIAYAFTSPDEKLLKLIDFEKRRLSMAIEGNKIPPGSSASLWDSQSGHDRHVLELACDTAG